MKFFLSIGKLFPCHVLGEGKENFLTLCAVFFFFCRRDGKLSTLLVSFAIRVCSSSSYNLFCFGGGVGEGKYLKDGSRGTLAICNSFDPMRGTRCALDQRGKFWFVENLWIRIWLECCLYELFFKENKKSSYKQINPKL